MYNNAILTTSLLLFLTGLCCSQEHDKYFTKVYVKKDSKKIIVSVRPERSGESPFWVTSESKLYSTPISCDSVVELIPCDYFAWMSSNLFYGTINRNKEVYIYNNDGSLLKKIENAVLFSPVGGRAIFVREYLTGKERIDPQVILYTPENDTEEVLIEFDKEKYTFHIPDSGGTLFNFDYYYGGYRGVILSTDWHEEQVYTFIIDVRSRKLKFWLDRLWIETDIRQSIPEEGIIKTATNSGE